MCTVLQKEKPTTNPGHCIGSNVRIWLRDGGDIIYQITFLIYKYTNIFRDSTHLYDRDQWRSFNDHIQRAHFYDGLCWCRSNSNILCIRSLSFSLNRLINLSKQTHKWIWLLKWWYFQHHFWNHEMTAVYHKQFYDSWTYLCVPAYVLATNIVRCSINSNFKRADTSADAANFNMTRNRKLCLHIKKTSFSVVLLWLAHSLRFVSFIFFF